MKSYMRLVNFEINRFLKFYLLLIGLTLASQLIGVVVIATSYMSKAREMMAISQLSMSEYVMQYGALSIQNFLYSSWFQLPILLCITVLMLYVFLIWYRDWFAKNSFIYRLLMLPTARRNIYFAKLTTIMLFVLGLIAVQVLLIQLELQIFASIIPATLREELPLYIMYNFDLLDWLYPDTFTEFLLTYGTGLVFVAVLFTAILIERSYGVKGIFLAAIYGVLSVVVFVTPLFIQSFSNYFYPIELIGLELVAAALVLGSAIWLANHLLRYKINV